MTQTFETKGMNELDTARVWEQVRAKLLAVVPSPTHKRWLSELRLVEVRPGVAIVAAPSEDMATVQARFVGVLTQIFRAVGIDGKVEVVNLEETENLNPPPESALTQNANQPDNKTRKASRKARKSLGQVEAGERDAVVVVEEALSAGSGGKGGRKARGTSPDDLKQRLEVYFGKTYEGQGKGDEAGSRFGQDGWFSQALLARQLAKGLEGLIIDELPEGKLEGIREQLGYETEEFTKLLRALKECGFGLRRKPKPAKERAHGILLEERLKGVTGKLPRPLGLRLPTKSGKRKDLGAVSGKDVWGQVEAGERFEVIDLGILAAVYGLYASRAVDCFDEKVYLWSSEIAFLTQPWRRRGGNDIKSIVKRLEALARVQISATVDEGELGEPSPGMLIPAGTLFDSLEFRIKGNWVSFRDLDTVDESDPGGLEVEDDLAPMRIGIPEWVRREHIWHDKEVPWEEARKPTFINLDVWRHLRSGIHRRLYAFLQARGLVAGSESTLKKFFLAEPLLATTFGVKDTRTTRVAKMFEKGLYTLREGDMRYQGYGKSVMPGTDPPIPAFSVKVVPHQRSLPTELAKQKRSRKVAELTDRELGQFNQALREIAEENRQRKLSKQNVESGQTSLQNGGEPASQSAKGSRGSPQPA